MAPTIPLRPLREDLLQFCHLLARTFSRNVPSIVGLFCTVSTTSQAMARSVSSPTTLKPVVVDGPWTASSSSGGQNAPRSAVALLTGKVDHILGHLGTLYRSVPIAAGALTAPTSSFYVLG